MTAFIPSYFRSYFRNTGQGLLTPLSALHRHSSLLWVLIKRDITNRTSGTMLGGFWPIIQTALQVVGFWFLFDVIYGMRMADAGPSFLHYLLVGILPWLAVVEVLSRACNMLLEFSPLYRRNPFPLELLPILIMVIPTVVFGLVYFFVCLFLYGWQGGLASLPVIPLLMLWLLPLCLLLPVLGLFMKDFAQAVPFLLTISMYATPILYFPQMMPEAVQDYIWINPFSDIMALIHGLVQGMEVTTGNLLRPLLLWLFLLGPCWLVFRRSQPHVREVL